MIEEIVDPQNREDTRNPDGTFKPGVSGNPGGRPKNTLKAYLQRKFNKMTDEEYEAWLIEHKVQGIDQWKMAEGNPANATDLTTQGDKIIVVPAELITKHVSPSSAESNS